jgi:RHS repeat-associated protein
LFFDSLQSPARVCFLCIIRRFPRLIYTVKLNGSTRLSYDFDQLARLSSRTIAAITPFTTTYTYLDGAGSHSTTTLLASLTNGSNPAYSYTVDANGNIRTIKEGSTTQAEYFYDTMNQLIREDSAYSSKSIDYVYDVGGNLTSKTIYTFTGGVRGAQEDSIVYLYENAWKDQLSSYDGQSITYDAIGNPKSYRNGLSFTWANGRELAGVTNNGVTGTFTYNDSGIRTSKTYNGVTTSYLLNGSSIVRQTQGESTLDFFYDENGNLYGFQKGTSTYYYLRNGQNDIVGILNSSGTQVVSYTYDAWGNQLSVTGSLSTTIGVENPFRYRGYYFDTETGLYYLNSRYYDSVTGRFINADGLISASSTLLGTNMYAFCLNNPVNMTDKDGSFALAISATVGFAVLAIVGIAMISIVQNNQAISFTSRNQHSFALESGLSGNIGNLGGVLAPTPNPPNLLNDSDYQIETKFINASLIASVTYYANANRQKYHNEKERHHIIAQTATAASVARDIWTLKCPFSIDDGVNTIMLPKLLHKPLHTSIYYSSVNVAVKSAYDLGGCSAVRGVVIGIKLELGLLSGDFLK